MKWLAGFVVFLVVATLALACDEDEKEPTPSPEVTATPEVTPSPTADVGASPTPAGETGDMEGFRAFAEQIEGALEKDDAGFFVRRARIRELTCPDQPNEIAACKDEPAGTVVQAFSVIAYPFEGASVTLDFYEGGLEDWLVGGRLGVSDEYGGGAPTLYALASSEKKDEMYAIATAILGQTQGPPERRTRVFNWQYVDGDWQLISGTSVDRSAVGDWLSGECGECYDQWERWEGAAP